MFNSTIVGRVGSDPAQRQAGTSSVANFTVAVEQIKRRDQAAPPAFWVSIDCWGKQTDYVMNNIRKGDRVVVSGEVQQQTWTDRQSGEQRTKLALNCNRVIRVGRPGEGGNGSSGGSGQFSGGFGGQQSGGRTAPAWGGSQGDDDDYGIPF